MQWANIDRNMLVPLDVGLYGDERLRREGLIWKVLDAIGPVLSEQGEKTSLPSAQAIHDLKRAYNHDGQHHSVFDLLESLAQGLPQAKLDSTFKYHALTMFRATERPLTRYEEALPILVGMKDLVERVAIALLDHEKVLELQRQTRQSEKKTSFWNFWKSPPKQTAVPNSTDIEYVLDKATLVTTEAWARIFQAYREALSSKYGRIFEDQTAICAWYYRLIIHAQNLMTQSIESLEDIQGDIEAVKTLQQTTFSANSTWSDAWNARETIKTTFTLLEAVDKDYLQPAEAGLKKKTEDAKVRHEKKQERYGPRRKEPDWFGATQTSTQSVVPVSSKMSIGTTRPTTSTSVVVVVAHKSKQ